jgi:hypothetical protein
MTDHVQLAEALRRRLTEAPAETPAALRAGAAARAADGPALGPPYDALAHQIGVASSRVSDAQVAAVRTAVGGDKAAFEIVMAAAIGAGLMRWDLGVAALKEANDAPR